MLKADQLAVVVRKEQQEPEGSQNRQRVKCGHGYRGARNQEPLCCRGPAEIYT
jgi:hypothetical protein